MILPVIILATILRLISLNQSFWLDEGITVMVVKTHSFLGIITQYIPNDFHPPLYYLILWIWDKVFGYSEIASRLPSVIFGVLAVWIIYLIGKKIHSKKLGIVAALLLAVNPLHIYYSQEARMYSFACFAVVLSFYFLLKMVMDHKSSIYNMVGLFISFLLIFGSDYVAYFVIPAQLVYLLLIHKNGVLKKWFIALVGGILLWSWFIPIVWSQIHLGSNLSHSLPAWSAVVGSFGIKPLALTFVKFIIGRISIFNKLIYALVFLPISAFYLVLIYTALRKDKKEVNSFVFVWLLLPLILGMSTSMFLPIYDYFRVLFLVPVFLLVVSLGLIIFKDKIFYILTGSVVMISLVCALIYLFNPVFQREDWRGVVNFLNNQNHNNSLILFESSGQFSPFTYYADNRLNAVGGLKEFPAKSASDLFDLGKITQGKSNIYLINYLVEITDPSRLINQKLINLGFHQTNTYNFNGVGFIYKYKRSL